MEDINLFLKLLAEKTLFTAIIAPSFPVMYEEKLLINKLRQLGINHIVEVSVGAKVTNQMLSKLYKENPNGRFITTPCASFKRMVSSKHPELTPFLANQVDSPMKAVAKIVREKYPGEKVVFIGPCLVKKFEAKEDCPELEILVLTFKELEAVFKQREVLSPIPGLNESFDLAEKNTRIYPMDGGLTETSGIKSILKPEEIRIVSGFQNCETALKEFVDNSQIRLLDVLFCEEGCINGPGIVSELSIPQRKEKILHYATKTTE